MAKRERITVAAKDLIDTVRRLVSEPDTRRVCLIHEKKRLLEVPRAVGDPAAPASVLAAPVLAALNAFATLVTECTVEVEKANEVD